jgi:LCP family protein required for cell wall assembly
MNENKFTKQFNNHSADTQPLNARKQTPLQKPFIRQENKPANKIRMGCILVFLGLFVGLCLFVFWLNPDRTNILLLGIDSREPGSNLGRSDTIIIVNIYPRKSYIGMLSIPRDLWVNIPGIGFNRINTAHFFAEAENPGNGPRAVIETIELNFGIQTDFYARIRFEGLISVIDALGGIDIDLPEPMAGYTTGSHHLNGEQALALVRDRQGSDDFFRIQRGQIFLKSVIKTVLNPSHWPRIPAAVLTLSSAIDTNIPVYLLPRLGFTLLRIGIDNVDGRTITREMTNPFTTSEGANVLEPKWELIQPLLCEMFGD